MAIRRASESSTPRSSTPRSSTTRAAQSLSRPGVNSRAKKATPRPHGPVLEPAHVLALPPEGAAQVLNISRGAVYRLIAQAKQGDPDGLPSIKVGKRRLVPVSALEAFVQRRLEAAS